jgi:hypothetical protein
LAFFTKTIPTTRVVTDIATCSVSNMGDSFPDLLNKEIPLNTFTGLYELTWIAGYTPTIKPVNKRSEKRNTQKTGYLVNESSIDINGHRLLYAGTRKIPITMPIIKANEQIIMISNINCTIN